MNIRLSFCVSSIMLMLTACGRDNGHGAGSASNNYVNSVAAIAASLPEDTEPADVESLTPNLPEDSEPQVIF